LITETDAEVVNVDKLTYAGIAKTVRWYLHNGWSWRPLRERVYAGERIGLINAEKES
jgi:dTDP-D-glucose 4,6-dehydratase